jgi:hypothetical protein
LTQLRRLRPLLESLFWIAFVGAGYSYFLYPLVLRLFANDRLRLRNRFAGYTAEALPRIT